MVSPLVSVWEGLIWSLLWSVFVLVLILRYPWLIEHDYPPDVRKAARLPRPSESQKRAGICFTVFAYVVLLSALVAAGICHYRHQPVNFGALFLHLWIICMMWNVFDLLILD